MILEARGLSKTYDAGETCVEALRDVNVQISSGEIVAIMGPSGSGKSTLLSLLGGVDTPSSGQVLLEGVDLSTLDDNQRTLIRRRRLGFIFQAFNLLPILTAVENVALPLELDGISASEARRRALEALNQVDMAARRSISPACCRAANSSVWLSRALVIQPALLLADELTGNLDSTDGQRIMELLRSLVNQHHQTIAMVKHDVDIGRAANRVIRLRDGRVAGVDDLGVERRQGERLPVTPRRTSRD